MAGQKAAAQSEAPWRQAVTGRESPVVLNSQLEQTKPSYPYCTEGLRFNLLERVLGA